MTIVHVSPTGNDDALCVCGVLGVAFAMASCPALLWLINFVPRHCGMTAHVSPTGIVGLVGMVGIVVALTLCV